jgi:hypothetical protein
MDLGILDPQFIPLYLLIGFAAFVGARGVKQKRLDRDEELAKLKREDLKVHPGHIQEALIERAKLLEQVRQWERQFIRLKDDFRGQIEELEETYDAQIETLRRENEVLRIMARDRMPGQGGKVTFAQAMTKLGLTDSALKTLLKLCHPDRHGNSAEATKATQWLNRMREKV